MPFNFARANFSCLMLSEDFTYIFFENSASFLSASDCDSTSSKVYLANAQAVVNYTIVNTLSIQNNQLHPWEYANGDIGLGYCPNCLVPTSFQTLLMNSSYVNSSYQYSYSQPSLLSNNSILTSNLIFGLDFNPSDSNSSMQLGYIKDEYKNNITWIPQAVEYPVYHQLWLYNIEFCNSSLMSNYSNNWQAIVDTGSVCLSLPGEAYDTLMSWFTNTSLPSYSEQDLPSISFSLSSNEYNSFVIPFSTLLINPNDIGNSTLEQGAPEVVINNVLKKICILKSNYIVNANGYQSPIITLGTLALHSMYFAADFATNSVALVSKYPFQSSFNLLNQVSMCKPKASCFGEQTFNPQTNSCTPPSCSSYFFTALDESSQTCVYTSTPFGFGVFFVVIITVMEFLSYFTLQYSAKKSLESQTLWESSEYARGRIDIVTSFIGMCSTFIIDLILFQIFTVNQPDRSSSIFLSNEILVNADNEISINGDGDADANSLVISASNVESFERQ